MISLILIILIQFVIIYAMYVDGVRNEDRADFYRDSALNLNRMIRDEEDKK